MERREFLGTLLGTLAISKSPFYAIGVTNRQNTETLFYRFKRYLTLPEEKLLQFKGIVLTKEGGHIWTPPIKFLRESSFQYEDLITVTRFSSGSGTIVDDEGFILGWTKWSGFHTLVPGDTLKLSLGLPPKDLIKEALRRDEFVLNDQIVYKTTKAVRVR